MSRGGDLTCEREDTSAAAVVQRKEGCVDAQRIPVHFWMFYWSVQFHKRQENAIWHVCSSVQWESGGTFIWTRVTSPARKVQTGTVLVLFCHLSAERNRHKETSHATQKPWFSVYMDRKGEFFQKLWFQSPQYLFCLSGQTALKKLSL